MHSGEMINPNSPPAPCDLEVQCGLATYLQLGLLMWQAHYFNHVHSIPKFYKQGGINPDLIIAFFGFTTEITANHTFSRVLCLPVKFPCWQSNSTLLDIFHVLGAIQITTLVKSISPPFSVQS